MVNLKTLGLLALALTCLESLPALRAVVPPPDGGYPGFNTAEGQNALLSLTSGTFNTSVGWLSLRAVTTGQLNTAIGAGALLANSADENTAIGAGALLSNTTGTLNTANGAFALFSNTTAGGNTATGVQALVNTTTGSFNTANGYFALGNNTTGSFNTALGTEAGGNVITAGNVICIGANVTGADVSNTTWIGNVYGATTQNGTTAPVIVSVDGQLGTVASSERFKKDIASMDKGSEVILSLRPVTFHYKTDAERTPQFGLIAEEVAKVNPALVLPDKEGKPYTVRYDAVNAMLLNEFLKEHRKNEEQQKQINVLMAQLKEQATQIQKVSTQLEASKPAPQVVKNP